MYTHLQNVLPNVKFMTHVGMEAALRKMEDKDLVIIDEADVQLIDKLCDLPEKSCKVIAMSATSVSKSDGIEAEYLAKLGFIVLDSGIKPPFNLDKPLLPIKLE